MTQSRAMSAIEAGANIAIGYGVSVLANLVVLPAFGFVVSPPEAMRIGLVFTAIAFVRSYAVRRLFEALRR